MRKPLRHEVVWGLNADLDTRKDEEKEQEKRKEKNDEVKRVMRKECRELRNHMSVGQRIKASAPWIFTMHCSQALWNITDTSVDTWSSSSA
jgi:hypothetical protein